MPRNPKDREGSGELAYAHHDHDIPRIWNLVCKCFFSLLNFPGYPKASHWFQNSNSQGFIISNSRASAWTSRQTGPNWSFQIPVTYLRSSYLGPFTFTKQWTLTTRRFAYCMFLKWKALSQSLPCLTKAFQVQFQCHLLREVFAASLPCFLWEFSEHFHHFFCIEVASTLHVLFSVLCTFVHLFPLKTQIMSGFSSMNPSGSSTMPGSQKVFKDICIQSSLWSSSFGQVQAEK